MAPHRLPTLLALLALLIGGLLVPPPPVRAAEGFSPAAPMATGRGRPSATLLPGGDLLVVGPDSAERYSPATDSWSPTGPKATRASGSAILLLGGQVLVAGGERVDSTLALADAERYDPATNSWAAVAPLGAARYDHSATLLPNGQVLVVGGRNDGPGEPGAVAERYDPATDRWHTAGRLGTPRYAHTATLLPDGRVLVTGGFVPGGACKTDCTTATAERYDPATDTWTPAGALSKSRAQHTATLLPDGDILAVGGYGATDADATAERYDPRADIWRSVGALAAGHQPHAATLLASGRVLVTGGGFGGATTAATEVYDPVADRWEAVGALGTRRAAHVAVRLNDGRVLVAGGFGGADDRTALREAEVYDEGMPTACFAESGYCLQGRFLDYWLANGGLARNGYPLSEERREVLEDGNEYTVQYFERVRLEYHPENPPPYDVLLGQFGRRIFLERGGQLNPAEPLSGQVYFPETGHNLGGRFLAYWQANGGLAQFGYPISEITTDWFTGGPSDHYEVQYFEQARFEYHPEHEGTPYVVLLGQFGRDILAQVDLLAANPDFHRVYTTDEALRQRLGRPFEPGLRFRAVTQAFEHGRMLYFDHEFYGEGKRIYALCGDEQRGLLVGDNYARTAYFIDTWDESQPAGGGPGPVPGLYEPRRGFGKAWRLGSTVAPDFYPASSHVRDCLGFALTPGESVYTIRV